MLFATTLNFNPLLVTVGVVVALLLLIVLILAIVSGLGAGHFFANKKRDAIREREAHFEIAKMAHDADAPHLEKLFKADATGSLFDKIHAKRELYKIALNPELARKLATNSAEHWLAHEGATPEGRKEIEGNLRAIIREHHGDSLGTFAAQVLKMLQGVKDETIVPTADGKTVTVPTHVIERHYYGAPSAENKDPAKPAEAAPATTSTSHGPITLHVHAAPAAPAAPAAAGAAAAPAVEVPKPV